MPLNKNHDQNLLIVLENLYPGGAELFALRLSQQLAETSSRVVLFYFSDTHTRPEILKIWKGKYHVEKLSETMYFLLSKLDRLIYKLGIDWMPGRRYLASAISKVIKKYEIDVVISHLFPSDYTCALAVQMSARSIKHIATMHGDYEALQMRYQQNNPIYGFLNFERVLRFNLEAIDHLVCINDNQLKIFKGLGEKYGIALHIHKIYNGYIVKKGMAGLSGEVLRKVQKSFVFGMVSRGVEKKGWSLAIEAFLEAELKDTLLVLVGSGAYLSEQEIKYSSFENILFVGHADTPLDWIAHFDVGLLPTQFRTEGLPTVIVEYMSEGKPIIASDVGEIRNMMMGNKVCGELIEISSDTSIYIQKMAFYMKELYENDELRSIYANASKKCFEKFEMSTCIQSYLDLCKD